MRVNGASMHGRHFASAARGVTERRIPLFSPRWLRGYVLGTMLLMLGSVPAMEAQVSASITGIVTDASGHRLSVSELSGRTVNYGYDNLYRLTSETIASDPSGINGAVNYTYDAVGNRKQITSTLAPIPAGLWNYDADDRFTAGDTYDANGNTVTSGGIANVYDFENHLMQQGGISIVYDGDGNRVQKTVAGVITKYLVDDRNPTGYAQVFTETTSSTTRQYVLGLERVSEWIIGGTTTTRFYDYDGHGSVRALTDTSGNVTDTYDYDAFGNLIHSTGTTPNNYLYSGEQFDSDLHLYYNRARYLNVSTGRFWSMDTGEGHQTEPPSLHKYLYTSSDPVNLVDPSGNEETLVGTIGSFSVAQTIAAISVITAAGVCAAIELVSHGPGFCGSKREPLTLYRGLSTRGDQQFKEELFAEDGLSLYESLTAIYRFRFPVQIDYLEPKTPRTRVDNVYFPPGLGALADITYTPKFENPVVGKGHWSLQAKGGISLKLLIELLRYFLDQAIK